MIKKNQISEAVAILKKGGLVAFPTETVYGLGADANNEKALQQIFKVKERPYSHPLIVHLARLEQMVDWAREIPPSAMRLAQAFWPGPLTLVLKKHRSVLDILTSGQDTIAIRVPRHPIAQALLQAFDSGIAAPSANKFTHVSPTTATAVFDELGNEVELILDGGLCEVGLESTILDCTSEPTILRPGMITAQEIEHVLQSPVYYTEQESKIKVPGMHHLHYSPITPTSLIDTHDIFDLTAYFTESHLPVIFLLRSEVQLQVTGLEIKMMPKTASEYAHHLYQTLHECDQKNYKHIFIENVPQDAEWLAIHDRLTKASATDLT